MPSKICRSCGADYDGGLDRCPLDGSPLVEQDRLSGRRLPGGYLLEEPIGRGALAEVYRARSSDGAERAVKVLDESLARSPRLRERFLREARAAQQLSHSGIIEIWEVGELEEGPPFLVMPLLRGETLSQRIGRGLSAPATIRLGAQIAAALAHAHERGVVHRDLKPANVLVCEPERAVLLDFGLARILGDPAITATGEMLGTPAYMAPERVDGAESAPAADVYALGCLLYEMMTGTPPFVGSAAEVLEQQVSAPPPRPSSVSRRFGDAADRLTSSVLEKDPEKRPGAEDVHRALEALPSGA